MTDRRFDRIVDALDRGSSVHAIAAHEGITRGAVQKHIRRALKLGILVIVDGRGRHKRPVYRRPRKSGPLEAGVAPAEQPVAVPSSKPDESWRHIEHAEFRWKLILSRPQLVPWDPASERMANGTRVFSRRHAYLGKIWGTVQLYSGTFTAVLHLDKIPVRWADMAKWNDILFSLAMDAQARLARDLADLGTSVDQTIPEPIEDPKATAARKIGEPSLITGELVLPVRGADQAPRHWIAPTVEFNRSPPGPAAETGSLLYGYVADHLPERVIALEATTAKILTALERVEERLGVQTAQMEKLANAQERMVVVLDRIAAFFERLTDAQKRSEQGTAEKSPENPDNWRMFG